MENINYKLEICTLIKDNKRDLLIVDREARKTKRKNERKRYYKYRCNKCNNEDWIEEYNLTMANQGCNVCCGRKATLGINTIWDTDRWMCDLGVSEEDAKRYMKCSNKKIEVMCPDCNKVKTMKICSLYKNKSIGCVCGDGNSYPNKFIMKMLSILNVNFKTEYSPDWIKPKRYDFYIPNTKTIIEVNGGQHYKENSQFTKHRSLKQEQDNDAFKKRLAEEKGINNYIVIDARVSDMDYIKSSVINSELNNMFDLSFVDWRICEEYSLSNIIKEACSHWNNKEEWETTTIIGNRININKHTLVKYLKKGRDIGWCNYDPKQELEKSHRKLSGISKPVEILKDDIVLGEFDSIKELESKSEQLFGVMLHNSKITSACKGNIEKYKGFNFRYKNDLEFESYMNSLQDNDIMQSICTHWNNKNDKETVTSVATLFNLDRSTARKYLKNGAKLGLCDYDTQIEKSKRATRAGKTKSKNVEIIDDKGNSLGVFKNASELENMSYELFGVKLLRSNISLVCIDKRSHHKGFTFKYI